MNGSILWGLFFLVIGANIILNALFNINIPIFKLLLAGFFIMIGINILTSPSSFNCKSWYRTSNTYYSSDRSTYNLSFCTSTIDLEDYKNLTEQKTVTINSQFSQATIKLPANVPVQVKVNNTLSTVDGPGQKVKGDYINLHGAMQPMLYITINATFSDIKISEN